MDGNYTDFYPAYIGAMTPYTPLESDIAPLQPVLSPTGAGGLTLPKGHHMPLIGWVAVFIVGAFVLMHMSER